MTAATTPGAGARCVGCGDAIDGPAITGPSGVAAHPACLAAHLPSDGLAVVLAALASVLAPIAVVWAG